MPVRSGVRRWPLSAHFRRSSAAWRPTVRHDSRSAPTSARGSGDGHRTFPLRCHRHSGRDHCRFRSSRRSDLANERPHRPTRHESKRHRRDLRREVRRDQREAVRWVYARYAIDGLSIGAITRLLNEQRIPTRKQTGRWERSTVWAMLRNPAYKGAAGFGKTQTVPRQRITRPLRLRGGIASRDSAHHERPQDEWIAIPVPPIIDEQTFALAQERLEANKTHAPRRTVVPSVVQGLVSCANCGYALYRTSTRSSARTIYYYRCLGSDAWRRLGGPICHSRPIRQDLLDRVAWTEIVKLLEEPGLIQSELDRRLEAARHTDPTKRREDGLRRDLARCK